MAQLLIFSEAEQIPSPQNNGQAFPMQVVERTGKSAANCWLKFPLTAIQNPTFELMAFWFMLTLLRYICHKEELPVEEIKLELEPPQNPHIFEIWAPHNLNVMVNELAIRACVF
jgi:hypothetical protein